MPFDGGEFHRALGPWSPAPVPAAARLPALAQLRRLLRGDVGDRGRTSSPGQTGQSVELPAVCLLREARALIETEETWTQGAYRTLDGKRCAVGALRAAARKAGWRGFRAKGAAQALLFAVAKERGFGGVELMNDRSTHTQMLVAFDVAIARADGRPPNAG